ncbi:MAG: hypothetical protein O3C54_06650 [Proteobacteria bacterium]|nr:hypothetical protein [Pseudomonadota bacterium]
MKKTLTFIAFGLFLINLEAQFKLPKNPLESITGSQEASAPQVDITQSQANLMVQLTDALGDVAFAQSLIAEAQGNAEKAAALKGTSDTLKGGNASDEEIKGAVETVSATAKEQQAVFNQSQAINAESKALYAKALLPYVKSVAKTSKLGGPIKNFTAEAQNSLKSLRNPLEIRKLKKTMDVGLFVGSNVPKLIASLLTSSKDLLTFAKSNDLDTSEASSIEL